MPTYWCSSLLNFRKAFLILRWTAELVVLVCSLARGDHTVFSYADILAVALGAPTVLNGAHPLMAYFLYLFNALRPPAKYCLIFGSFGWAGGAVRQIRDAVGSRVEVLDALEVNGRAGEGDLAKIVEAGKRLAEKVKGL